MQEQKPQANTGEQATETVTGPRIETMRGELGNETMMELRVVTQGRALGEVTWELGEVKKELGDVAQGRWEMWHKGRCDKTSDDTPRGAGRRDTWRNGRCDTGG